MDDNKIILLTKLRFNSVYILCFRFSCRNASNKYNLYSILLENRKH